MTITCLPRPTLALHAVTVALDGVPVRTLDLRGLLKTKQSGREKDAADRAVLERAIRLLGPRAPGVPTCTKGEGCRVSGGACAYCRLPWSRKP